MAKVRRFNTDIQGSTKPAGQHQRKESYNNPVPNIPREIADRITDSAPVKIKGEGGEEAKRGRGNPRTRRYRQKTYSLIQEDIDLIESLVAEIRKAGLYERGRSDIVRAGVLLLSRLPVHEKVKIVEEIESLKS